MGASRRAVLGTLSLGAVLALPGGTAIAQQAVNEKPFHDLALVGGRADDLPEPGGDLLGRLDGYHYLHVDTETGAMHTLEAGEDAWSGVHTKLVEYATAALPDSPALGTLVFDTNRDIPAWWDGEAFEWPSFVDNDDVLTTPQTVADTAAKTEVYSIGINEGSMVQGRVYQLDLFGTFGTANTSDQFTVIIELGGTEIATLQNEPDNASGAPWSMETTFTVRTHGENGQIQPHSRGVFDSVTRDDHHPTTTVDTTVVEMLTVSLQWDAADPADTVTLGQAHLKQMG